MSVAIIKVAVIGITAVIKLAISTVYVKRFKPSRNPRTLSISHRRRILNRSYRTDHAIADGTIYRFQYGYPGGGVLVGKKDSTDVSKIQEFRRTQFLEIIPAIDFLGPNHGGLQHGQE